MYEDSIAHLRESAALFKSLSDADPGNTNLLYALTSPYRALGIVEGYRKNHAESAANFQIAAALHERLLRIDPTNKVYRFLRGELLVRAGNELVPIGNSAQAFALTRDGLEAIRSLAAAPDASLTHLFGGCRWFTETKVVALRDGPAAASFCRKALEAAGGADIDALAGLAQALKLAGDRTGALRELEKAIALLPPTAAGQPVSRQRLDLEAELRSLSRAAR
jgi:tetratricopeptide (TPR) repeat protein